MTTTTSSAYEVMLSRSAVKAQTKLDKPLRLLLKQALELLATNPKGLGEQLKQPLTMLRSHHVRYKGLEWRIAYQLNEDAHVIYVVLIGPHENFYRTLKQCLTSLAFPRVS
jgi:mRNA-degrading endonuclease RelE of RelBE toxin-antitoxin system